MPPAPPSSSPWRAPVAAALLGAFALIVLTWPVFRHPATTVLDTPSLYGDAAVLIQRDINLTLWVLAWDTHALTTDPGGLFHANAFHPAPLSLALSEHMLGNVPIFAPIYLATGNPILAHQLTLLATFALAAACMAAYVRFWTRDDTAAVVAGLVYAIAPTRLWQLGSLHVVSIHLLPAVLLGIDLVLDRRRGAGPLALLVGALVGSSLCSYYVGYQAFVMAGLYGVVGVIARRGPSRAAVLRLAGAGAAAALLVALVTLPYLVLQRSGTLPNYEGRDYNSLAFYAIFKFGVAGMLEYFVRPLQHGIPQFLTWTALTLALAGTAAGRGTPRGRLVVIAIAGAVLSLGPLYGRPETGDLVSLPYDWLARAIPGFSAMRAPQRFGSLATVGVVALAGIGLAALRSALLARHWRRTALVAAVVAGLTACLEVHPGRLSARRMPYGPSLPRALTWLRSHGEGGAVLHLPLVRNNHNLESLMMYFSTFHWLPIANGYSSYPPRSYLELVDAATTMPAAGSLERALALVRPRWVVYYRRHVPVAAREAYERRLSGGLRLVEDFGDMVVYETPPA